MKKIYLAAISCMFTGMTLTAQYCTTGLYNTDYGCLYEAALEDFSLGSFRQNNTGCGGEWSDFTSLSIQLNQGESYPYMARTSSNIFYQVYDYLAIWVDYNDNGSFDEAGEMLVATQNGGELSGIVTIPADASEGSHRMRVRIKRDYGGLPFSADNSCTYFFNGEAQDYTLVIGAAPSCHNPSLLNITAVNSSSFTANWDCDNCTGILLEYGPQGYTPGNGSDPGTGGSLIQTDLSPVAVSGLSPSTSYDVYIRRLCDDGRYSSNLGPVTVLTKYDACATFATVTCGETITADVTPGEGSFFGYYTGKEKLYRFIPTVSGIYTFSILNAPVSFNHYFKPASPVCDESGWLTLIASYEAFASTFLLDTLEAGTEYWLMLDAGNPSMSSTEQFRIDCIVPSNPCDAIPTITCGTTVTASLPAGAGSLNEIDYLGFPGKEKIFRFIPQQSGVYTLTALANPTYYQLQGFFYKKAADGCMNQNWHWITTIGSYYSDYTALMGNLAKGVEYLVMIDNVYYNQVDRSFIINCTTPYLPCDSILEITCGVPVTYTASVGAGSLQPTGCLMRESNILMGKEKIFSYTPAVSGNAGIILSAPASYLSSFNTRYFIKEAGNGCDEQGWTCINILNYNMIQQLPFPLQAGSTYYIMADYLGIEGVQQDFRIICPEAFNPCTPAGNLVCEEPVTADISAGIGTFKFVDEIGSDWTTGKELIYTFTVPATGSYQLVVTETDYQPGSYVNLRGVFYFIKDATDGCGEQGWTQIAGVTYPTTLYNSNIFLPFSLISGRTYSIMLDAPYAGGHQVFYLKCPPPSDPCAAPAEIHCNEIVEVVHESGLGVLDPRTVNAFRHYPGKETMFVFTPDITGNYALQTINYNWVSSAAYFIKPVAAGCNEENWEWISDYPYPGGVAGIPLQLQAGTSYYILADGYTIGQSFRLLCPTESYDPCTLITQVTGCAQMVTVNIPPGLGAWITGKEHFYNNSGTSGKEIIFSFTPGQDGYYGFKVEPAANSGIVSYSIKEASAGCHATGWQRILDADQWGGATVLPFQLKQGITYYILADATTIAGISQQFSIICPPSDPCNSITTLQSCGWENPVEVNLPSGTNPFNLAACYDEPYGPIKGGSRIYAFTPAHTGRYSISDSYAYRNGIFFFIKDAAAGCGADGWICMKNSYPSGFYLDDPLLAGHTYYILVAARYSNYFDYPVTTIFNIDCSRNNQQYKDRDRDGYGDPGNILYDALFPEFGYGYDNTDCDDQDNSIYPGASEICGNKKDDDCDGLVDENCCTLTASINAEPAEAAYCNALLLRVNTSNPVTQYAWSNGATNAELSLSVSDTPGIYRVTVTDKNGCSAQAQFFYDPQQYLSSFTILALKELKLKKNNVVINGSAGVNNKGGEATLVNGVSINGPGAFLKAENVQLTGQNSVNQVIREAAGLALPPMRRNTASTSLLPNRHIHHGSQLVLTGNFNRLNIGKNCNITLTGTIFGKIKVDEGSIVRFTAGSIQVENLDAEGGRDDNVSIIRFNGPAELICKDRIQLGKYTRFNPEEEDVRVYIGTTTNGSGMQINGGRQTTFNGFVYCPDGKIRISGNDVNPIYMKGKFIAGIIESDGKNVYWNNRGCTQPATTLLPKTIAPADVQGYDILNAAVWPNPTQSHFSIRISSNSIEPAMVKVLDATGRVMEIRKVNSGTNFSLGAGWLPGTYWIECSQNSRKKTFLVVKL